MLRRISILGGDLRQRWLAEELRQCGFEVAVYQVPELENTFSSLQQTVKSAQALALPMPALTKDGWIRADPQPLPLLPFRAASLRLLCGERVTLLPLLTAALRLLRRERIALPLLRAAFLRFPSPCGTIWIAPTRFSAFVFHKPYSVSMICPPQSRRLCTRAA